MKKKILVAGLFLGCLATNDLLAQKYLGLSNSNYSGVYGTQYNPAKLTDSKVKVAVNLASVNGFINNDYYKFNDGFNSFKYLDLNRLGRGMEVGDINSAVNLAMIGEVLGPSVQFTLNDRLGFGVSTRVRAFVQGTDINSYFLEALNGNQNANPVSGVNSLPIGGASEFGFNVTGLTDFGIKGAYAIVDNSDLKFSLGASVRLYKGFGLSRFQNNSSDLVYNYSSTGTPTIRANSMDWTIYTSQNILDGRAAEDYKFRDAFNGSTGFGGDIGAEVILKEASNDRPYLLKFGASVNDIGSIKYKDMDVLRVVSNTAITLDPSQINLYDLQSTARYLGLRGARAIMTGGMVVTQSKVTEKQSLPTNLNLYADYSITNKFFVSANGLINLAKTNSFNPYYHSFAGLVPRFESKWVDVSVPLTYNFVSKDFKPGIAFRFGPLSIGSDDLKVLVTDSKGANVYAGLGFLLYKGTPAAKPIPSEDKDSDGDGILDKDDKCPYEAGPRENQGCPWGDIDGDGVPDKDDECPEIPGPKENNGCPWKDTDGDGVLDKDDRCPTEPGPVENQGCPKENSVVAEEVTLALKDILFNFGKSTISEESYPKLDEAAKLIKASNGGTFLLVGHTDKKGSAAINLRLSRQRAAEVVKALESRGVNPNQLKSQGVGARDAQVPATASDAERVKDRRVEVKYVSGADWDKLSKSDVAAVTTTTKKVTTTKKTTTKKVYRKPVAKKRK